MGVIVWRKKPRLSQELQADVVGLFSSFHKKINLLRVRAAIFLLAFIFICSSSSTINISNRIHPLCVSSRKLNDIYCRPAAAATSVLAKGSSSSVDGEENAAIWIRTDHVSISRGSGEAAGEVLSEAYKRMHRSRSRPGTCGGRGIYVYELPSKFNKDLLAQCTDVVPWLNFCKYVGNGGLGEAIEELGGGWYNTHQYALEPIFHARVLKHPCRVYNQDEAKVFYVPYYGGLDVLRWHFKNVSNDIKDSMGMDLLRWLQQQGSWYNNSGKDHVFVLGKISWDFRRKNGSTWGNRLLELDQMQNPIKLLIERHLWHNNDIGIPHPTFFHPRTDQDILAWQLKVMESERKSAVSFAGAARPSDRQSIRSILIDQCTSAGSGGCELLNCTTGKCGRPEAVIGLFTGADFCLQPPGDSATRKSVFDSLVSGCIPVLFDPKTAYYQYPWHLPEDRHKYSVFIDMDEVRNRSVNVVERLIKIPTREREKMRKYIVYQVLPGLVYGDLNSEFHKFEDAFSISINNLVERVSRLKGV